MALISNATSQTAKPTDLPRILRLNVPVIVKLAERRINVQEVLGLSTGSIIEFFKGSNEELELLINNKTIGTGVAVKVGENFGIKLTNVGDVRQIVAAMTPER